MYLVNSPIFLKNTFSDILWKVETDKKHLFFTFDDGPHPEVTPIILDLLKQYQAFATFFCVGENIEKYPELFQRIKDEGHQVGNHTYSHTNGWKVGTFHYLRSYLKGQRLINTPLFRPPYGRISKSQYNALKKTTKIVFWSVLSGDFDPKISPKKCISNVQSGIENGAIVVFHDSLKAKDRVLGALPVLLEDLTNKRYIFKSL